jgi:tryptophan synthase alpha chain
VTLNLRRDRPLLAPYVTGGIRPDWTDYLHEYARNGADAIEIGLPFSDPILDGPTIQEASDAALRRGVTVRGLLDEIAAVDVDVPLIAMTYYNLVVRRGAIEFCRDLAAAGIRGLIVPDLPVDESASLSAAAVAAGIDLVLLAAPTTPADRLAEIASASRGFVYAVSTMGITGARTDVDQAARTLVDRLRDAGSEASCVGLGISTATQVAEVLEYAEGAIVGSALVKALADGGVDAAGALAAELARGTARK